MSRETGIFLLFLMAFLFVTTPAVAADAPVYRQVIKTFHNDSYYTKGLPATETVADGAGRVFAETTNTYTLKDVYSGTILTGAAKQSVTATAFPQLAETVKRFLEGGGTSKSTKTTFTDFIEVLTGDD